MKLIILKSNLLAGLVAVERGVGSNTNLPILKSVHLRTQEGKIILSSTNLEFAVQCTVSGKVIDPGEVVVPFQLFNSVIKNLNAERVSLERHEKKFVISSENYEAFIPEQDAQEFPIIPSLLADAKTLTLNKDVFLNSLSRVIVATQYSDIRPEISGVYLSYQDSTLVFAATDSFRLAERTIESKEVRSKSGNASVILPFRTAEEVLRILPLCEDEEVEITLDATQVLFSTQTLKLTSRLIDGTFPQYRSIIPKEFKTEVVVRREEFLDALRLVSAFSGKAHDIRLLFEEHGKHFELIAQDASLGENKYRIPAKIKGDSCSLVFNWRFLADGLRVVGGEDVFFSANGADRPVLLRSPSESSFVYVAMPIRS